MRPALGAAIMVGTWGALEFAYLSATAKRLYEPNLVKLQGGAPVVYRVRYAILAYIVMFATCYAVVLRDVLHAPSQERLPALGGTLVRAAFFGLAMYGTYNLTNLATLIEYSPTVALVDTAWGCAVVTLVVAACWLAQRASLGRPTALPD